MSLRIIVLAKQVPDTRNVGKDAMKADGTVNRAALPAIFNPEDLNALEQALRLSSNCSTVNCDHPVILLALTTDTSPAKHPDSMTAHATPKVLVEKRMTPTPC